MRIIVFAKAEFELDMEGLTPDNYEERMKAALYDENTEFVILDTIMGFQSIANEAPITK